MAIEPQLRRLPWRSLGERFVGRSKELEAVRQKLQEGRTAVIQGAGLMGSCWGLGKSRLAVEYAHRFCEHYPGGVFWLDAGRGMSAMADQLAESALLEVDTGAEEPAQLRQAWEGLSKSRRKGESESDTGIPACEKGPARDSGAQAGMAVSPERGSGAQAGMPVSRPLPTLVILDDFPEGADLQDWLPPAGPVRTLVTTRRQDLGGFGLVQLAPLDQSESARLLTSGPVRHPEEAYELAGLMGGIPLALQAARAILMRHPGLSPSALANWIRAASEDLHLADFLQESRHRLPGGSKRQVAGVLLLAWKQASWRARAVLAAMAFLAPFPVPQRLLAGIIEGGSWARRLSHRLLALLRGRSVAQAVEHAVLELSRLALVETDADGDPRLHPLTASFVRCAVASPGRVLQRAVSQVRSEMAAAVTQASLPVKEGSAKSPVPESQAGMPVSLGDSVEKILTHAEFLAGEPSLPAPLPATSAVDLCRFIARHYRDMGRLHRSAEWQRRALERAERDLPESRLVTACQADLALALRDLGLTEEACRLLRLSLETDSRLGRLDHHSLTARRTTLALMLKDLGLLDQSAEQLRQVLSADLERRPIDPLDVAKARSNLASVLLELGELEEAAQLLRQALETAQARLDPGAVGLAVIRSNLASVLVRQGEVEEARSLLHQAHEALLDRHGLAHPRSQGLARMLQSFEEEQ